MVYGGRSSPLNPVRGLFKVTLHSCDPLGSVNSEDRDTVKLCEEQIDYTGDPPPPRWRHTATTVRHKGKLGTSSLPLSFLSRLPCLLMIQSSLIFFSIGKDFLFVFGGKNESEAALGDSYFLSLEQQHWTEVCCSSIHLVSL